MEKKHYFYKFIFGLTVIVISVSAVLVTNYYLMAWSPPTSTPPGGVSPGLGSRPWFVAAGSAVQDWVASAAGSWTWVLLGDAKGSSAANYNPANGRFTAPETGLYYCFVKPYKSYSAAGYHHTISTCFDTVGAQYVCNSFTSWDYTLGSQGTTGYDDSTGASAGLFYLTTGHSIAWRVYSEVANSYVYYPRYTREGCVLLSY